MNLDTLKEIVKIAKDEGVRELKVEGKDFKVAVSFGSQTDWPTDHGHSYNQQSSAAAAATPPAAPVTTVKTSTSDVGLTIIKSPFVGTFYSSPSPGKPLYVNVGDKVKVGQPLCVLEAMKIMNEIDADTNGEIVEICVDNESLVEFGQPLFKIKPNK
jgi:acetyl-CoA carboxylase biotin carboxyl carrier protein